MGTNCRPYNQARGSVTLRAAGSRPYAGIPTNYHLPGLIRIENCRFSLCGKTGINFGRLSAVFVFLFLLGLASGPEQQRTGGQDGKHDQDDEKPEDAAAAGGGAVLIGFRRWLELIAEDDGLLGGLGGGQTWQA